MRKRGAKTYLLLLLLLFALLSLPTALSERIRSAALSLATPIWSALHSSMVINSDPREEEIERLKLQNQLLATENYRLRELMQADWGGLEAKVDPILAQVIFRSATIWNSALWINVGEEHNRDKIVVAKNSPVLYGRSLVGVIDYVGKRQARVRLITDLRLTPAVRAMRLQGKQAYLLAKGEIHGSSQPLWRRQSQMLHGIGFNYDFEDQEGPARDLRTGRSLNPARPAPLMPIIQVNDLLVTTGMDGVFPAGLEVALVTQVHPLKEGDYYYEIEAKPTAGALDRLSFVLVIPPIGYDPDEQPALGSK
jgi:rod shape-determining protein MreC